MQRITIEVKDHYANNVMEMLHSVKDVMIEKIKIDSQTKDTSEYDFIKLQMDALEHTWDNQEDEAWNDL